MGVVKRILLVGIVLLLLVSSISCSGGKKEVLILAASSLMVPFGELAEQFESIHPDVYVRVEGHGSIQVCRHTVELGDPASLSAVADYSLLPLLVYTQNLPDTNTPYADWSIDFSSNRLGLSYTDSSKYSDEITADNWYEILARNDVTWGMSDPRLDACGYRTLMLYKLAEQYYDETGLFQNMVINKMRNKITVSEENGITIIKVPEILYPTDDNIKVRGFSAQLLNLVEYGTADYAFQYESQARQHGLNFLELPQEIDLSSLELMDHYHSITVRLDYERYGTVKPEFRCEPITYSITIPASAPYPDIAEQFIQFMLSDEGSQIFLDNYQVPFDPPTVDNMEGLPDSLKPLVQSR